MQNIYQRMCTAQMLNNHLILNQKAIYRKKYISILQYFGDKYGEDDKFSMAMLDLYKERILSNDIEDYNCNAIKNINNNKKVKIKYLKLYKYRFALMIDCFFLYAFCDKDKAEIIFRELKSMFHPVYYKKMNMLFRILYDEEYAEDNFSICRNMIEQWKKNKVYTKSKYRFALMIECFFLYTFCDKDKAEIIFRKLKSMFHHGFYKKINTLFRILYDEEYAEDNFCICRNMREQWQKNKEYMQKNHTSFLITANMSAGKSTLINALIGKMICQAKNDACTAKIHYIHSKPYEDFYNYEYDYTLCLNATHSILMEDNEQNESENILVGTYFRTLSTQGRKILLIDTPGVNSSLNREHSAIAKNVIETKHYDKMIYVINGGNIGSYDDKCYLQYIAKIMKSKDVIFVLNKVDQFKIGEDSIQESIISLEKDLEDIGFENPQICPISAYAGLLGKKKIWGDWLNEDEIDELDLLCRKFKKDEYNLSQYYSLESQEYGMRLVNGKQDNDKKKYMILLNNSGILALENMIMNVGKE